MNKELIALIKFIAQETYREPIPMTGNFVVPTESLLDAVCEIRAITQEEVGAVYNPERETIERKIGVKCPKCGRLCPIADGKLFHHFTALFSGTECPGSGVLITEIENERGA